MVGVGCQQPQRPAEVVAKVREAKIEKSVSTEGAAELVRAVAQAETGRQRSAGPLPPGHSQQLPAGHPPIEGEAGSAGTHPSAPSDAPSGVVEEVIQAGRYTYLRVAKKWCAVTAAKVTVGQKVALVRAMKMTNFRSKVLKRVFKEVWFGHLQGNDVGVAKPTVQPASVKDVPSKVGPDRANGSVLIAAVHAKGATLAGQLVTIRGRVVKANDAILDRAWLHMQDGSGRASDGNHDITVTMDQLLVAIGDVVTVRGRVALNRDFGSGYSYPIMIEKAVVVSK